MKRTKEEEKENKRGVGGEGGNRGRNKEGNCSGMEAMTVITFQTNYHRASGNELRTQC